MRLKRPAVGDLGRFVNGARIGVVELLKLAREMLVIPAQLWLALAEMAGFAVLTAWRRALRPVVALILATARALYRLALRHVRPLHGVAAVTFVAIAVLAASQWVDYRGISVGTGAYSESVEIVAPAPEVARERAGDAHSWLLLPLAVAALAITTIAIRGRHRLARLLAPIGLAAIVVAVVVDAPKGLDEGATAVSYEGAEARLLEGFWLQIAAGAVLIACGLLLARYIAIKDAPQGEGAVSPAQRAAARLRSAATAIGAAGRLRGRGTEEPST